MQAGLLQPLAGLSNWSGYWLVSAVTPDWMGLQFVLPGEVVLLAGFYV